MVIVYTLLSLLAGLLASASLDPAIEIEIRQNEQLRGGSWL